MVIANMILSYFRSTFDFLIFDSLIQAMGRYLIRMAWCAGASTDLNCSLCQEGTYQTGSGETVL
jgi:hypothetical protein